MNTSSNSPAPNPRDLFLEALEKHTQIERAAFLDGACRGDTTLRAAVEALLATHREDSFLEDPAMSMPTVMTPSAEQPGERIGQFKLLQQIGEGGFGTVWMAEQVEPVTRRVALKIIKLGMDTREVIARFEAERQALAMLDHPNIAKVLDAGATEKGRPFFVMELVKGIPITRFCDEKQLGTRERLALFGDVCSAINHAHAVVQCSPGGLPVLVDADSSVSSPALDNRAAVAFRCHDNPSAVRRGVPSSAAANPQTLENRFAVWVSTALLRPSPDSPNEECIPPALRLRASHCRDDGMHRGIHHAE